MAEVLPEAVALIFFRKVTDGDFWNIERTPGAQGPTGGGGQLYIDVPLGGPRPSSELWEFLGQAGTPGSEESWPTVRLNVRTIGKPDQIAPVEFAPRRGGNARYRITNQNRNAPGGQRHPSWSVENGFPQAAPTATSTADLGVDLSKLRIYIVKTVGGAYYAGFVDRDTKPDTWPSGFKLERIFSTEPSGVIDLRGTPPPSVPPLVAQILDAWRHKPNVLLYGPSGTGKTFAMQAVWDLLNGSVSLSGLALDPTDKSSPFRLVDASPPFPVPARREWVTFHQNYAYEGFIVGLRPESGTGVLTLKPRFGVLMDAAIDADAKLAMESGDTQRPAVIFIDEVNRGNVSRIFGEFITFMDPEYRAEIRGKTNPRALPVSFGNVRTESSGTPPILRTEPIERLDGSSVQLPVPWEFPEPVYVLASMNSVDRAVAPLDTALARRFARIEVAPDMELLANRLGVSDPRRLFSAQTPSAELQEETTDAEETEEAEPAATEETSPPAPDFTVAEIAWLLLYRLNYELSALLGADFEIGHTYLWPVGEPSEESGRLTALARVWDQDIFPQLRERLVNRPDELLRLLRLSRQDNAPAKEYLIARRAAPVGPKAMAAFGRDVLDVPRLADEVGEHPKEVKFTLTKLAGL